MNSHHRQLDRFYRQTDRRQDANELNANVTFTLERAFRPHSEQANGEQQTEQDVSDGLFVVGGGGGGRRPGWRQVQRLLGGGG